jgi:hypothetical protein
MTEELGAVDIAWMRKLAEEGASTPFRGGGILMAAGLIYGTASLLHWAAFADVIPGGATAVNAVWLAATVAFLLALFLLLRRLKQEGAVRTFTDRAAGMAWSAAGWSVFALFLSLMVLAWRLGEAALAMLWLVPSIVIVFYGLAWSVTAAMTRSRTLGGIALASFAAAPALAALAGSEVQYLGYAAALFGLAALPGFLLMRQARRVRTNG